MHDEKKGKPPLDDVLYVMLSVSWQSINKSFKTCDTNFIKDDVQKEKC
jgi:hypothetical protein